VVRRNERFESLLLTSDRTILTLLSDT